MSYSEKKWITKHVSRFAATGTNMARRKKWSNSRCSQCSQFGEDSCHVVTCQINTTYNTFSDEVLNLQEKLQKTDTHPNIVKAIILGLLGSETIYFCDIVGVLNTIAVLFLVKNT